MKTAKVLSIKPPKSKSHKVIRDSLLSIMEVSRKEKITGIAYVLVYENGAVETDYCHCEKVNFNLLVLGADWLSKKLHNAFFG